MACSVEVASMAHRPLDRAWMALPPSWCTPILIPVKSATMAGPDTNA